MNLEAISDYPWYFKIFLSSCSSQADRCVSLGNSVLSLIQNFACAVWMRKLSRPLHLMLINKIFKHSCFQGGCLELYFTLFLTSDIFSSFIFDYKNTDKIRWFQIDFWFIFCSRDYRNYLPCVIYMTALFMRNQVRNRIRFYEKLTSKYTE